ncbi:conserved hypothetical protein [Ammonifex degensii KC4]|uniref:DUF3987 domain-containing protein n=1 Tax=Ammonifex degensii (strain DSM 10501 / KC4) TaxID=429009 RepID=C9R7L3_AMMDK|nr:hypothetical protein [Ammonifex degensii]ACX52292.1 conserved hypothetical protein [Ammonifex degensii KC4]
MVEMEHIRRLAELEAEERRLLLEETNSPPEEVLPPFPEDVLTGICGDVARLFAEHLEAPVQFWYFSALTALGAAISGHVTLAGALREPPRLYTVLVGESADPRKSTAIELVSDFFKEALGDLAPYVQRGIGSAEGLAVAVERLGAPRRVLLELDELKLFVDKAMVQGSVLLTVVNSLFSRVNYDAPTKHRNIRFEDTHLSLLAACTRETYESMWTPAFLDIGFVNRLWVVPGKPTKDVPLPRELPEGQVQELKRRLREIVEKATQATFRIRTWGTKEEVALPYEWKLGMTPEAERIWSEWYTARPRDLHAKRLETYGLRLAVLLEASRGNFEAIEADTIEKVVKLLRWQHECRQLLFPVDAATKTAIVEEKIRKTLRRARRMAFRDLYRAINAQRYGGYVFELAVRSLVELGEVEVRGGRKRRLVVWVGE